MPNRELANGTKVYFERLFGHLLAWQFEKNQFLYYFVEEDDINHLIDMD